MAQTHQPGKGQWQRELFDCGEDCGDFLCAIFCRCCHAYTVAKAADESTACAVATFFIPAFLCCIRGNIREKKGIEVNKIIGNFSNF